MSDNMNELLAEMDKDEELRQLDDQNYFAEQDKKFKELQMKLTRLKEENKKQMDIIINSLDQLILNKNVVEKTLEQSNDYDESIIADPTNNLTVVDLLSKVTGFINNMEDLNTSNKSLSDQLQEKVLSEPTVHDSKKTFTEKNDNKDPKVEKQEKKKESSTSKCTQEKIDTVKLSSEKNSTDIPKTSDTV